MSKDMNYSCAIFDPLDERQEPKGNPNTDVLYEAHVRKMKYVIDKARILPGHRVLDLGCGWGSLAIMIAQSIPNTKIDAITLSASQVAHAREQAALAGLSDRVTFHDMDCFKMPADWQHAFDRVISIELIPHIEKDLLETFWAKVHWAMKPTNGIGVVVAATVSEESSALSFILSVSLADFISQNAHPSLVS